MANFFTAHHRPHPSLNNSGRRQVPIYLGLAGPTGIRWTVVLVPDDRQADGSSVRPNPQPTAKKPGRPRGLDPLAYYHEHYAGLTRGQVQKANPALYQRLRSSGLLSHVPRKDDPQKRSEPAAALAEYRQHYQGLSRLELFRANGALYQRMRRAGVLQHVPRKKPGPRSQTA